LKVFYIVESLRVGGRHLRSKGEQIGVVVAEDKKSALKKTAEKLKGEITTIDFGEKIVRRNPDQGADLILEEAKLVII